MAKYRKKSVEVEAVQWDGHNYSKIVIFVGGNVTWESNTHKLSIQTLEGLMTASAGDFIIKGVKGEFYPCKPDIFEQTYEVVE